MRHIFIAALATVIVVAIGAFVWLTRGSLTVRRSRLPTITKVIRLAFRRRSPRQTLSGGANTSPKLPIAWSATPHRVMLSRRSRVSASVRYALFDKHHSRQGHWDWELHRSRIPRRRAARHSEGWRAALSGHALHLIRAYD